MRKVVTAFFALLVILWMGACGSGGSSTTNSTGESSITLQFKNTTSEQSLSKLSQTSVLAATSSDPSIFGMKLIAAYVTEDIDPTTQNNVGSTEMIYLNADCEEDIMHCDISAGTAEDDTPFTHIVTSYFNLADPSTANTALNSSGQTISAGTYKYARLEFCKYNTSEADNIEWGNASTGTVIFRRNACTVNSAVMDPPLEVIAGDTITFQLSYDLSNSLQTGTDATGDNCTGDGASKVCFTLPTFVPSVEQ